MTGYAAQIQKKQKYADDWLSCTDSEEAVMTGYAARIWNR